MWFVKISSSSAAESSDSSSQSSPLTGNSSGKALSSISSVARFLARVSKRFACQSLLAIAFAAAGD